MNAGRHRNGLPGDDAPLPEQSDAPFDTIGFLAIAGVRREVVQIKAKRSISSRGEPAGCVFYLQAGRAKLTVVSERSKKAIITLLAVGDFIGDESVAGPPGMRMEKDVS